jgi:hypothetical protein
MTPDELAELGRSIADVMQAAVAREPTPGRIPYVLSPILFPRASV